MDLEHGGVDKNISRSIALTAENMMFSKDGRFIPTIGAFFLLTEQSFLWKVTFQRIDWGSFGALTQRNLILEKEDIVRLSIFREV